jgi:hypothetical protein
MPQTRSSLPVNISRPVCPASCFLLLCHRPSQRQPPTLARWPNEGHISQRRLVGGNCFCHVSCKPSAPVAHWAAVALTHNVQQCPQGRSSQPPAMLLLLIGRQHRANSDQPDTPDLLCPALKTAQADCDNQINVRSVHVTSVSGSTWLCIPGAAIGNCSTLRSRCSCIRHVPCRVVGTEHGAEAVTHLHCCPIQQRV